MFIIFPLPPTLFLFPFPFPSFHDLSFLLSYPHSLPPPSSSPLPSLNSVSPFLFPLFTLSPSPFYPLSALPPFSLSSPSTLPLPHFIYSPLPLLKHSFLLPPSSCPHCFSRPFLLPSFLSLSPYIPPSSLTALPSLPSSFPLPFTFSLYFPFPLTLCLFSLLSPPPPPHTLFLSSSFPPLFSLSSFSLSPPLPSPSSHSDTKQVFYEAGRGAQGAGEIREGGRGGDGAACMELAARASWSGPASRGGAGARSEALRWTPAGLSCGLRVCGKLQP